MGLYAANGSIRITVVDGNTRTGLYASDGSWNVTNASEDGEFGIQHPCGAFRATYASTPTKSRAPDGSLYVQTDGLRYGGLFVTVVTGSFGAEAVPGNEIDFSDELKSMYLAVLEEF
jgi:hypothetical protein